ncbi:MAG: RusA family crossover junction endodeoxyribonuclease [Gammaproteobacteria bacterium]|nr:RusA family crossover junction endodeoxyribonuclease [Gammaproteobacteria bacterium]
MGECIFRATFHVEPVAKGRHRGQLLVDRSKLIAAPMVVTEAFIRKVCRIGMYTPAGTRKFEASIKRQAIIDIGCRKARKTERPVIIAMTASLPIPDSWPDWKKRAARDGTILPSSKPDFDNYEKAAVDALNGVVYLDDAQIVESHTRLVYSDTPSLSITVWESDAIQAGVANRAEFYRLLGLQIEMPAA